MAFKEINPSIWTYGKEGDSIEGVLVDSQDDVGVNKSKLYSLEVSKGDFQSVWGSAVLDQRMSLVKIGEKIRITFKGLSEASPGKNPAKIFSVEVDSD